MAPNEVHLYFSIITVEGVGYFMGRKKDILFGGGLGSQTREGFHLKRTIWWDDGRCDGVPVCGSEMYVCVVWVYEFLQLPQHKS